MQRVARWIDPKRAALLLIAAALALGAVSFNRLDAGNPGNSLPSAPSDLSATATSTSLTLNWRLSSGFTDSFEVKLGVDGATVAVFSGSMGLWNHTFSNLTANTSYTLYVRAKNTNGFSDWSSLSAATLLAAPSGLSAQATRTSLTLKWTTVTGATGYEVKLRDNGPPPRLTSATVTVSSGTSHTFSDLTANLRYTLYVRAKDSNSDKVSKWSSISIATWLVPLSATATGTSLTLSWTAATGATSYEVKLGAEGAVTVAASGTSHTFTGLTANTSYTLYMRVTGWRTQYSFESNWSSLSAATAPAAPSGLSATATATSLTLSWDAVTGATGYEVKRGAAGAATTVSSGASHSFSGLTANTPYMLYVRAKNSSGASDWSSLSAATAPAAPSGLSATATATSLTLSWDAVTGATGYEVKRGAAGAATTVSSGTSHSFTDLTANTSYTLYVRAKNSSGASGWSSLSAATQLVTLSATATSTSLTLSWDAVTGATGYEVKLGTVGAVTAVSSGTSHSFTGLTANTSYTLYMRAIENGGPTDWSSLSATTLPAAPSGLSATATASSLTLSWTAVSGVTSYEVKLGADGAVTAVSSGTSHSFTGLTANTSYALYVRAKNSSGVSTWSSLSSATLLAAPSGLSATATDTSLTLSWTAVTGATSYEVKRAAAGVATTVSLGTSHSFTSLTANTSYTLYVRAKNSGGDSDWSSLSTTTLLAAPSGLSATATTTSLTLSWTASSGATSHEVKRDISGAATTVSSGASHTFSSLTAGTEYTLYVRARNSGASSTWRSLTAITVPAAMDASRLRLWTDNTNLSLEWRLARVTGAASYEVKLGPDGAVTTPSIPPYAHLFTSVWAVGEEYTLYVRARNSGGASDWSWVSIDGRNPPLALTGLNATATSDSLTLSWTSAPSNATIYEVKRGASGAVTEVAKTGQTVNTGQTLLIGDEVVGVGDAVVSELSHTFTGLTGGTEYTLYVRAKNSGGTSPWNSLSAATSLAAPSGLSVATTLSSLTLSWDSVTGATSYEVKQGASGAATAVSSGTSHTFSGLAANTSYTLYVRAKNSDGVSDWSSLSVKPWLFTLSASATNTSLTLSWTATTGATSYDVKLGDDGAVTTVTSGTNYTFTGLTANTSYTLYIRVHRGSVALGWSSLNVATLPR